MTLQDEFNDYLATNRTEAVASLADLAARFTREQILQPSPDRPPLVTAVPLVLAAEEGSRLSTIARAMCGLATDVPHLLNGVDAVLDDNREPAALRPFIKAQIPYSVRISRCDFLRGPDGWYLIEINTSPSCDGLMVHEYNDCIADDPFLRKFLDAHSCVGTAPLDLLADTILERCAALPIDANPTVAIADWHGAVECLDTENAALAKRYLRYGFSPIICHHRELSYSDGRLWCAGKPVDVVHRLFLLEDLANDPPSAIPVLEAAVNGSIVLVTSFFDEWAAFKHSFALFHQAADAGLLADGVAELVAQSVPRTWRLTEGEAGRPGEEETGAADHLVLKPVMGHSGAGVVLGAETSRDGFECALTAARASGAAHVMQHFVATPPVRFPWFEHEALTFAAGQLHPGVFVIEGRTAGLWTRVMKGDRPQVINIGGGSHRGGVWCEPTEPV
jgi:hypothetical protein